MNESSHCSADTTTGVAFEIAIENVKLEYCGLGVFPGKNKFCVSSVSRVYAVLYVSCMCAQKRGPLNCGRIEAGLIDTAVFRLLGRMSRKKGRNNVRVFLFSCSTTHNNKKEEERLLLFRCCYTRPSHRSSVVDWSPCCVDASKKTFLFFLRNSHKFFSLFFWRH